MKTPPVAKPISPAPPDIVDWRACAEYKAERGIRLEWTGRWDSAGRPVFVAVDVEGETE